jgi:hypothetical protein
MIVRFVADTTAVPWFQVLESAGTMHEYVVEPGFWYHDMQHQSYREDEYFVVLYP